MRDRRVREGVEGEKKEGTGENMPVKEQQFFTSPFCSLFFFSFFLRLISKTYEFITHCNVCQHKGFAATVNFFFDFFFFFFFFFFEKKWCQ